MNTISKPKIQLGRSSKLNRFNRDHNFINDFQKIMIERLNLNHIGKYDPNTVNEIIRKIGNRDPSSINTEIKDGFLLTCNIEPEMYVIIQEIMKKLTGKYTPMDELIYCLLSHFIITYIDLPRVKPLTPYKRVRPGQSLIKLKKFHKYFSKYYHNTVVIEKE